MSVLASLLCSRPKTRLTIAVVEGFEFVRAFELETDASDEVRTAGWGRAEVAELGEQLRRRRVRLHSVPRAPGVQSERRERETTTERVSLSTLPHHADADELEQ